MPLPPGATRTLVPRILIFPVGLSPVGLAFDGESVWVASSFDDTVRKLTILE